VGPCGAAAPVGGANTTRGRRAPAVPEGPPVLLLLLLLLLLCGPWKGEGSWRTGGYGAVAM